MRSKYLCMTACSLLMAGVMTISAFAAPRIPKKTVVYTESEDTIEKPQPPPDIENPNEQLLTVRSAATGKMVTDTAYNILCMVAEAEVGSSFEPEAIKAQVVAAHTYILYHMERGMVATCPLKKPGTRVKNCVQEVVNEVILYQGKLIQAVYCASSGGGTQASVDYWGGNCAYLQAADCPYDIIPYSRTLDREYVRKWFPESTFPENPNDWFEILTTNENGFVLTIRAGDQILSGYNFTSTDHIWLKSNKITSIDYNEINNTFTFNVLGWGHGVGLSQIGANGYAKYEGRDYKWILSHFYANTTLYDLRENN